MRGIDLSLQNSEGKFQRGIKYGYLPELSTDVTREEEIFQKDIKYSYLFFVPTQFNVESAVKTVNHILIKFGKLQSHGPNATEEPYSALRKGFQIHGMMNQTTADTRYF